MASLMLAGIIIFALVGAAWGAAGGVALFLILTLRTFAEVATS